jgi:hypothetical protein
MVNRGEDGRKFHRETSPELESKMERKRRNPTGNSEPLRRSKRSKGGQQYSDVEDDDELLALFGDTSASASKDANDDDDGAFMLELKQLKTAHKRVEKIKKFYDDVTKQDEQLNSILEREAQREQQLIMKGIEIEAKKNASVQDVSTLLEFTAFDIRKQGVSKQFTAVELTANEVRECTFNSWLKRLQQWMSFAWDEEAIFQHLGRLTDQDLRKFCENGGPSALRKLLFKLGELFNL